MSGIRSWAGIAIVAIAAAVFMSGCDPMVAAAAQTADYCANQGKVPLSSRFQAHSQATHVIL